MCSEHTEKNTERKSMVKNIFQMNAAYAITECHKYLYINDYMTVMPNIE